MKYGICDQTLVPVRVQPGERNEMINQLIFGDVLTILEQHQNWLLIESTDDRYDGWVEEKQLAQINQDEYNKLLTPNRFYTIDLATVAQSVDNKSRCILTMGSRLPGYHNQRFSINNSEYYYTGEVHHSQNKINRNELADIAIRYLDAPYLWGGRSPFGIDCSGFVQLIFKLGSIYLPRDSNQQVLQGKTINFIHEAKMGDLAFFGEAEGSISHVGILLDDNKIIHASGKVRIDKADHHGIFNTDTKRYTHKLRVIKSLFNN